MTAELESMLGALGLTIKNLIVGAFFSFVGLKFWNGLGVWERWTTFLGGWGIAAWGGPPLRVLLELRPEVELLVVMLLALFGIAISAEVVRLIRETDWRGMLRSVVDRFGNRKPPAPPSEGDRP